MILIAMGVSGAGKTRIGEMLAERLHCAFTDGDAFHSAANKEKMHHGIPLTDEDRWPWLQDDSRGDRGEAERGRDGGVHVFVAQTLVSRRPARRRQGRVLRLSEGLARGAATSVWPRAPATSSIRRCCKASSTRSKSRARTRRSR